MGDDSANAESVVAGTSDNMENEIVENNNEVAVDEEVVVDPRSKFRNRFKESNPDLDTENQDDFYNTADEVLTGLEDYKNKNMTINQNMIDTFDANPELAGLMKDVMKGAPLNVAIARNIDIESLAPVEGDVDEAPWKEALEGYKTNKSEKEAYMKNIDDNVGMSVKEIQAFAQENELSSDDTEAFLAQVDELIADAITGKVSKQTLSNLYRATTADNEVNNAAKAAKVEGLNENIDAKKAIVKPEGDGLPKIKSTTVDKEPVEEEPMDPFSAAINHQLSKKRI